MTKKLITAALAVATLTACGPTMKSEHMASIEAARLEKHAACTAARKDAETARLQTLKELTPEQTTMALMADAMARQAEALGGKGDPCAQGLGAFEMERDVARSRNETIGNLGGTALRVGGAVGGAVVAADAIKSVAKTAGNKTEINGDGNTYSNEQVTSNSEQRIDTGDESSVSATAPTVSGPDKSSETIHEAAPVATPEAEEPTDESPAAAEETAE